MMVGGGGVVGSEMSTREPTIKVCYDGVVMTTTHTPHLHVGATHTYTKFVCRKKKNGGQSPLIVSFVH